MLRLGRRDRPPALGFRYTLVTHAPQLTQDFALDAREIRPLHLRRHHHDPAGLELGVSAAHRSYEAKIVA